MSAKEMVGYKNKSLDTCRFRPQQVPGNPPRPHAGGGKRKTSCGSYRMVTYRGWELDSHYPAPPVHVLLYRNQGWIGASGANSKFSGPSKSSICHTITLSHSSYRNMSQRPLQNLEIYLSPVDTGRCSPEETCCCV